MRVRVLDLKLRCELAFDVKNFNSIAPAPALILLVPANRTGYDHVRLGPASDLGAALGAPIRHRRPPPAGRSAALGILYK